MLGDRNSLMTAEAVRVRGDGPALVEDLDLGGTEANLQALSGHDQRQGVFVGVHMQIAPAAGFGDKHLFRLEGLSGQRQRAPTL